MMTCMGHEDSDDLNGTEKQRWPEWDMKTVMTSMGHKRVMHACHACVFPPFRSSLFLSHSLLVPFCHNCFCPIQVIFVFLPLNHHCFCPIQVISFFSPIKSSLVLSHSGNFCFSPVQSSLFLSSSGHQCFCLIQSSVCFP